ncbi:MAG: ABC transporter permease [Anaerolineae bacterium]|nr:ABC transporter permease [Anaerolineae bacterium]
MVTLDEQIDAESLNVTTKSIPAKNLLNILTGFFRRALLSEYFILYLTITYFIILSIFFPTLADPKNLSNQLSNVWPLLAVAVGQTFVLIIAGIDLSQGSVMAITSVIGAIVMTTALDPEKYRNSPLWGTLLKETGGILSGNPLAVSAAVIIMLGLGALIGFFNGTAITRFNMPPFMVTLVSLIFFSAFAIYLPQSRNINNLPPDFLKLGQGDIVSVYLGEKVESTIKRREILPFVTYPMIISLGVALAGQFLLRRTVFGRQVYAIGTNRKAAEISGIPTKRVIILVYMFSGICAAIAAILYSARLEAGRPTLGAGNLLLDIIGACVIGGTSLFGGKGKITWTFFGVLFFVLLLNTLNTMRLSSFHIDALKGAIILIAALLDVTRTRLLSGEQRT